MFYIKCKKIYILETRQDYLQCIGYFLFLTVESWLTLEPQIVSYYCFKSLFYLFSQQWKPLFKWLLNLRGFSWIRQGLTGNKNFFFFFFYLVGYRFFPLLGRPTKVFSKWQIYINWVRVAEVWLKWRNSKHFHRILYVWTACTQGSKLMIEESRVLSMVLKSHCHPLQESSASCTE